MLADEPFRFATGKDEFTGESTWSLAGLMAALSKVDLATLEYHSGRGDLALWARTSLGDEMLAERLERLKDLKGESLRKNLLKAVETFLQVGR